MKTVKSLQIRGERLLMKIHRGRLVPIRELSEMASIINQAFELGKQSAQLKKERDQAAKT